MTDILKLLEANRKIPMHMPGHKRNTGLAPYLSKLAADCDITEIDGYDNLHEPCGIIERSMTVAAQLWGSVETLYSVNGSTGAILAAIHALVPRNGKVICARNCHNSVYNALELIDADVTFVYPEQTESGGVCGCVLPLDVRCAIEANPDAALVVITSPTYEGVVSDVYSICKTAHEYGIPVLVDSAHGAHFGFGFSFPRSAVQCGADVVVQSVHKTLPSLTQTAVCHINNADLAEKVRRSMAIFETSSPSYLLISSIDGCVNLLTRRKDELFCKWKQNLDLFYRKTSCLKNLRLLNNNDGKFFDFDRSKIVILTDNADISGSELADELRKFNIECEMSLPGYVVAMTGLGDTEENMAALADALAEIDKRINHCTHKTCNLPYIPPAEKVCTAYCAEKKDAEYVPVADSDGQICAEYVWAYPPGIPMIIPGERITAEFVKCVEEYSGAKTNLTGTGGKMPDEILCLSEIE